MDERCKNFRNFGTKLKNIYRYVIELKPKTVILSETKDLDSSPLAQNDTKNKDDKEIIEKLNETIKEVTKNLDSFNLHLAVEALYNFVWHDFADVYIEKSKKRREEAQPILD
ncbi:MAG: class I tRNA ligase family protein, partial [Patescibacteria group bacterium]|nr:class I tRNA ligase family protein [Patescibacteria group bacterium]